MEFRMNILTEDFKAYGQDVLDKLNEYAKAQKAWSLEKDNYEGVRVNLNRCNGNGWFLLRLSLHDPLLPLNIESNSKGGAKKIATQLYEFVKTFDKLDASSLASFVNN